MRILWLVCLAQLICACTPHEIRCDGRLEPINTSAPPAAHAPDTAAQSGSGVP